MGVSKMVNNVLNKYLMEALQIPLSLNVALLYIELQFLCKLHPNPLVHFHTYGQFLFIYLYFATLCRQLSWKTY